MTVKDIKNLTLCLFGSSLLVLLAYTLFINPVSFALFSANGFLDVIESLPWKIIYFVACTSILCLECLSVKYNDNFKLSMACWASIILIIIVVLLFSAFAITSNDTLFNGYAFWFMIFAIAASILLTIAVSGWKDPKAESGVSILFAVICMIVMFMMFMFNKEMMAKDAITQVASKYKKEFVSTGFIDINFSDGNVDYDKKRSSGRKEMFISNKDIVNEVAEKFSKYNDIGYDNKFKSIRIFVKNDTLYINDLKYDKDEISKEDLAKELDIAMEKVIMPTIHKLNVIVTNEENNRKSYE